MNKNNNNFNNFNNNNFNNFNNNNFNNFNNNNFNNFNNNNLNNFNNNNLNNFNNDEIQFSSTTEDETQTPQDDVQMIEENISTQEIQEEQTLSVYEFRDMETAPTTLTMVDFPVTQPHEIDLPELQQNRFNNNLNNNEMQFSSTTENETETPQDDVQMIEEIQPLEIALSDLELPQIELPQIELPQIELPQIDSKQPIRRSLNVITNRSQGKYSKEFNDHIIGLLLGLMSEHYEIKIRFRESSNDPHGYSLEVVSFAQNDYFVSIDNKVNLFLGNFNDPKESKVQREEREREIRQHLTIKYLIDALMRIGMEFTIKRTIYINCLYYENNIKSITINGHEYVIANIIVYGKEYYDSIMKKWLENREKYLK